MIRSGRLPQKLLLLLKTSDHSIEELMFLTDQGNKRWIVFNALQKLIKSHRVTINNDRYFITAIGSSEFEEKRTKKEEKIESKCVKNLVPSRSVPEFKPMSGYEESMRSAAKTRENTLQRYHVTTSGVSVIDDNHGK